MKSEILQSEMEHVLPLMKIGSNGQVLDVGDKDQILAQDFDDMDLLGVTQREVYRGTLQGILRRNDSVLDNDLVDMKKNFFSNNLKC